MRYLWLLWGIWVCVAGGARGAGAQTPPTDAAAPPTGTRARYTKFETYIPMRDGARLYTVVFVPRDISETHAYPILMERTPYGIPYGPDNFPESVGPSSLLGRSGYIVAYQDVRGTHLSEGQFVNVRPQIGPLNKSARVDESTDTFDTIDWLVKSVPFNNGRVGLWGISYPGFYAAAGSIHAHPALKAVSPQAPIADWWQGDDFHHNGALFLMDNFAWEWEFDFDFPRAALTRGYPQPHHTLPTRDAYQFYLDMGPLHNANDRYLKNTVPYWNEALSHEAYDDYWQARNLLPHLRNIAPATLLVGGWFDAEDFYGPISIYQTLRRESPQTPLFMAIGPWPHGGWAYGPGDTFGDLRFPTPTGAHYREEVEFPFFEYYLKSVGPAPAPAKSVQVFVTGANQWKSFPAWPPPVAPRDFYLRAGFALLPDAPTETASPAATDTYRSDPQNPVPYSATAHTQPNRDNRYMVEDQRFVAGRADVLTYQTPPLDADTTLAGPLTADLWVTTTGTDADFIVKVIDVYPDGTTETTTGGASMAGYRRLVRAQVMRGKFRDGGDKPRPFVPGKPAHVAFTLPDVCHTVGRGHRLMVQIQSSWFPLVDRNPQTFVENFRATEGDFHPATIGVCRDTAHPSRLRVGVLR